MKARYNIAPGEAAPVVRRVRSGPGAPAPRRLDALWWGLIPYWAKDEKIAGQTINARSETVDTRPAFRDAFRRRRCIVPADGFYEWKEVGPKRKQPYFIHRRDGAPIAYAGLWERWRLPEDPRPGGGEIVTYTILTVAPNELVSPLHDRMPAILDATDFDLWLDPEVKDPAVLKPLLKPYPAEALALHAVDTYVNKAGNEGVRCIEPVQERTDDAEGTLFSL